jgi:hypothetical protein
LVELAARIEQASLSQAARELRLNINTFTSIVRLYIANNFQIFERTLGIIRVKKKLNYRQRKHYSSREYLDLHAHRSLEQRCDLIEADIGVKISRKVLVRYYKEIGVVHRRLAWMTLPKYDPERQLTIKQSFVANLVDFMGAGKEIIYFDETSTHLW